MPTDHPATDIRITTEAGIVRVTYRGKVVFDLTTQMLREVAGIAAQSNASRLLFDIRDADYRQYHLETIKHSDEGPSLGIPKTFRVAFLGARTEERMLRFVENVTANRGYKVRTFIDEGEALTWLRRE